MDSKRQAYAGLGNRTMEMESQRDLFRELQGKHLEQSRANLHDDLAKAASKTVTRWCKLHFGCCGVLWVAFGHRTTLAQSSGA